ncbi:hypothetical protein PENTCL1PPCAC_5538, partial [Pristionchus entomophagus]
PSNHSRLLLRVGQGHEDIGGRDVILRELEIINALDRLARHRVQFLGAVLQLDSLIHRVQQRLHVSCCSGVDNELNSRVVDIAILEYANLLRSCDIRGFRWRSVDYLFLLFHTPVLLPLQLHIIS